MSFSTGVKARLLCAEIERQVCLADPELSLKGAKELLSSWLAEAGKVEDADVCAYLAEDPLASKVEGVKVATTKCRVKELYESLPDNEKASALA